MATGHQTLDLTALKARLDAEKAKQTEDKGFNAPPIEVNIGDSKSGIVDLMAEGRQFKSQGLGWYAQTNTTLHGLPCRVQVTISVVGSKPKA